MVTFWKEPSSSLADALSLCPRMVGRKLAPVSTSPYKDINPTAGALTSWPHLNLVISQRPYFQIPSPMGLELQHINLGDTYTQAISACGSFFPNAHLYPGPLS